MAEKNNLMSHMFQRNKHFLPVSMDEVYTLLETYCLLDSSPVRPGTDHDSEIIIGLDPPAFWRHKVDSIPFTMMQPFWGHMNHLPLAGSAIGSGMIEKSASEGSVKRRRALDLVQKLSSATESSSIGLPEIGVIASDALSEQIAELLGVSETRLDPEMPLNACGIDSLSAIDVRDYVRRVFGVEMPVFEILEGATLQTAGWSIAKKLQARIKR